MKTVSKPYLQFMFLVLCKYPVIGNTQRTYCDDHYHELEKAMREHVKRCTGVKTDCCEDQSYSLKRRLQEHNKMCPQRGCIRDLLIVWDNSNSVGKFSFTKYVQPFIKQIIDSENLKVGPDGTQMGIISFSGNDKTKVILPFGSKTTKNDLKNEIDSLDYDQLRGVYTMTGRALQIANEIFPGRNPDNRRQIFPDIVILITDGNPRNGKPTPREEPDTEIAEAVRQADRLKMNDIRIVTVAVGKNKNMDLMKRLSSGKAFDVENFDDLSKIVDNLVDELCKPLPGFCLCSVQTSEPVYVKAGHEKKSVWWPIPELRCDNTPDIVNTYVQPKGAKPGDKFGIGQHIITYTFSYKGGTRIERMTCPVHVMVKTYPCGGKYYDPLGKMCCGGVLHDVKPGWKCCGSVYHDKSQKCCIPKLAFMVDADRQCPN